MENYFVQIFGLIFLLGAISLMSYITLRIIIAILGTAKYFKESIKETYAEIKAKQDIKNESVRKRKEEILKG